MSPLHLILSLCLLIPTLPALANGDVDENSQRSNNSGWTSGKRFTLDEEYLTFDIAGDTCQTTVDYRLRDNDPQRVATMYFPVPCPEQTEASECLPPLKAVLMGNRPA